MSQDMTIPEPSESLPPMVGIWSEYTGDGTNIPEPSESLPPMVSVALKHQTNSTVQVSGVEFKSVPTKSHPPIEIVDNKIRVDEHWMEDDIPYAFWYLDKIHILTRTNGKLTLYELQ